MNESVVSPHRPPVPVRGRQLVIAILLLLVALLMWLPESFWPAVATEGLRISSFSLWSLMLLVVCLLALTAFLQYRLLLQQQRVRLLEQTVHALPDVVFMKDPEGIYQIANGRARAGLKTDPIGRSDYELFDTPVARRHREIDLETMRLGSVHRSEEWLTTAEGHRVLLETSKHALFDPAGGCIGVLGVSRDVTELRQTQSNLEHVAHHDSLTGLANRAQLNRKFDFALRLARRRQETIAVIFIDLDRFKEINDAFSHDIGDLLLQEVANRLKQNLRDSDLCARLSGDEFVLVLPGIGIQADLGRKVAQLLDVISEPYDIRGHQLTVCTSAGVSCFPEDGDDIDTLIRHADAALLQAKENGRNGYYFYDPSLSTLLHTRMTLDQDLRLALAEEQFRLVYQPQFRLGETLPRRVEALLRWQHPLRGNISPVEFIAIAEASGLIIELGQWVLERACCQFLAWREQGLKLEKIAINVSAIQINTGFAERVMRTLRAMDFQPGWLELEITETAVMSGIGEVTRQINQLRAQGVEFSIDDFGTGYSSLSKIKSMPVALLKIDQSFVRDINDDINDYEIARAVILMAKSLGLTVVAEGVENKAQENTLQRLGCDWVQGYLFGMPLSGEAFLESYRPPSA